jgi:hypothetical protein
MDTSTSGRARTYVVRDKECIRNSVGETPWNMTTCITDNEMGWYITKDHKKISYESGKWINWVRILSNFGI